MTCRLGLVASDEDEQRLLHERFVVEALAVDLGMTQHAHEIRLWRSAAAVGDDAQLELAELDGCHHRLLGSGGVGDGRASDQIVGPAQEVVVGLTREPEHVADQQQGQRGRDVPHEIALTLLADPIDDEVAERSDLFGLLADPLRREPAVHEPAPALMLRVVH